MRRNRILWFFLGAVCFTVSQPLLRLPILLRLQQETDFVLAYTLHPIPIGILIAFSAGVFEEGARFLLKRFLLKPSACTFSQPILFGLGHGIAEALIILGPAFLSVPFSQLGLAVVERGLTIILHVTLTITVWNGFQRNQRLRYLLFAVAIHGATNSLIPILSSFSNSVFLIEGALAVVDGLMLAYCWHSKKYYLQRSAQHEQIKG